jgi:Tfp pilus assembly protein PilO
VKFQANPKVFVGLAAVAFLAGGVGSYMQFSSLQDIEAKSEDLRKQMRDPAEVQKQVTESSAKLSDCSSKLSHLEKGVPQMAYLATTLRELDQIGTQNGIDVLGVRPIIQATSLTAQKTQGETQTQSRKPYQELNIEVKGRGDYHSVQSFVRALQRFPKIVAARTVSITPKMDSANAKDAKLDISIELRAYLFPPTKEAPLKVQLPSKEGANNG